MHAGIIQHRDRWARKLQGKIFESFAYKRGGNSVGGRGPVAAIVPTEKPPAVEPEALLGRHKHVFVLKLPAVGYVPLLTDVGLIPVKQGQLPRLRQRLQLPQALKPLGIAERVGLAGGASSDTFISATKAFKKGRKVSRPTGGCPAARWLSHSAFARARRWRLASTAPRTAAWLAAWSAATVSRGLRPRPGLVCSPVMPACR
jgi:hypothetical protein